MLRTTAPSTYEAYYILLCCNLQLFCLLFCIAALSWCGVDCSSTSASSEIENEHWHVANEAVAKGKQAPVIRFVLTGGMPWHALESLLRQQSVIAGTVPRYPLRYWKHFFIGPGTRRKTALVGIVASVAVVAFAVSQNQLAAQLLNMTL